jgi:hypothetical protein
MSIDPRTPMLQDAAAESWLRQTVHTVLDAIASTLERLLDLPLYGVLTCACAFALVLFLWSLRLARQGRRRTAIGVRVLCVFLVAAMVGFAFDRQMRSQRDRIEALRRQNVDATAGLLDAMRQRGVLRSSFLADLAAVRSGLERSFAGVELRPLVLDEATDLILIHLSEPLVCGALAVIDLQCPTAEIVMDADFVTKHLTSEFGRAHGCTVAINGEAGNSGQPNCGLGRWRGNLVIDGKTLLSEEAGNPRPFLCFDEHNRARYVALSSSSRALTPADHNVIWGRVDAIVDGEPKTEPYRFNQPRTVMGIDREGKRLFLLVVDSRQPGRSDGFTHAQVAQFLLPFGVHGAMLCDEGGSACMFASAFAGLVTVPSDNHGEERPTYTHFGVRLAAGPKQR